MGPQGAVNILYKREIDRAEDKDARRAELVREYVAKFANPLVAAERGYVDAVIQPRTTRRRVIAAFALATNKRDWMPAKKHGNIPL